MQVHRRMDVCPRRLFWKNPAILMHGQYDVYLLWLVTRMWALMEKVIVIHDFQMVN